MKLETIKVKKITADDGKVLTNGEAYGKEIYLGCNDTPENWQEINEADYKIMLEKQAQN